MHVAMRCAATCPPSDRRTVSVWWPHAPGVAVSVATVQALVALGFAQPTVVAYLVASGSGYSDVSAAAAGLALQAAGTGAPTDWANTLILTIASFAGTLIIVVVIAIVGSVTRSVSAGELCEALCGLPASVTDSAAFGARRDRELRQLLKKVSYQTSDRCAHEHVFAALRCAVLTDPRSASARQKSDTCHTAWTALRCAMCTMRCTTATHWDWPTAKPTWAPISMSPIRAIYNDWTSRSGRTLHRDRC